MAWIDPQALAWRDALLAWLHVLAFLSWTVFLSSCTALARSEWINAAALKRLLLVQRVASAAGVATLFSGVLRVVWSNKGAAWTLAQPLLWAKLALVAWMLWAMWRGGREVVAWMRRCGATGELPGDAALTAYRRRMLRAAHLMLWLPLAGLLLSRGLAAAGGSGGG